MTKAGLAFVVALFACTHSEPVAAPTPDPAATPPIADKEAAPPAKTPPTAPAAPADAPAPKPHDVEIDAVATKVSLTSPGKGKRVAAKIAATTGAKTPVEMHIDFQPAGEQNITLVFKADAEAVTADKAQTQYKLTINAADLHSAKPVPPEVSAAVKGVVGMTMLGTVGADGAAGKLALHHDAISPGSIQLMDLFKVAWLPSWPSLPTDAIAPGATWQAVTQFKLAEKVVMTETVDYQLVTYKQGVWTIKGTSKITGDPQTLDGAQVTAIAGTGSIDATLTDGALIPTMHRKLSASFTVAQGTESAPIAITIGNDIGADTAASAMGPAK